MPSALGEDSQDQIVNDPGRRRQVEDRAHTIEKSSLWRVLSCAHHRTWRLLTMDAISEEGGVDEGGRHAEHDPLGYTLKCDRELQCIIENIAMVLSSAAWRAGAIP